MPATVIRMLLNHFRWDKEKLMERYYDGDQAKLFTEAHVLNPFNKAVVPAKAAKKDSRRAAPNVEECEVSIFLVHFNVIMANMWLLIVLCWADLLINLTFIRHVWVGVRPSFLPFLLVGISYNEDHVGRHWSNDFVCRSQL